MARFISPITDMKPNGSLRFFKSGTNSPLTTYADELEKVANPVFSPATKPSFDNACNVYSMHRIHNAYDVYEVHNV